MQEHQSERQRIARYLPALCLTDDAEKWRAPKAQHIRMLFGPDSKTGISCNAAAKLLGVSPQNLRKYTASERSKNIQVMSFDMWHFLLHRVGIKTIAPMVADFAEEPEIPPGSDQSS